jgi:acetyl esterase/lipase
VSTEQQETLDAILRRSAFPAGSDINEQRRLLRELVSARPLPADVTVTAAALGGVPTAEITIDGIEPRHVVPYFHGGVYVLPRPAAAFVMSPYADLTLAGTTMETKREADPLLSREKLQPRVTDYTAGQDAALGLISPIFADLSGLPPLIIQAGQRQTGTDLEYHDAAAALSDPPPQTGHYLAAGLHK